MKSSDTYSDIGIIAAIVLVGILLCTLFIYAKRVSWLSKQRIGKLNERKRLDIHELIKEIPSNTYSAELLVAAWNDVARAVSVDPQILRASDRVDTELADSSEFLLWKRNMNDDICELFTQAGVSSIDVAELHTVGDLVGSLARARSA